MSTLVAHPEGAARSKEFPPASLEESQPQQARVNGPRARILYAEDEVRLRRFAEIVLVRAGYSVTTVADGTAALAALALHHFDLLITDNNMPCMSGVELIRNLDMEGVEIPVIMVSGNLHVVPEDVVSRIERTGAVLEKPFSTSELTSSVDEALRLSFITPPLSKAGAPGSIGLIPESHALARASTHTP